MKLGTKRGTFWHHKIHEGFKVGMKAEVNDGESIFEVKITMKFAKVTVWKEANHPPWVPC